MILNYAQEEIKVKGKSIFLAGPTPRKKDIKSWRKEAIKIFEELNFNGTLFIPEFRSNKFDFEKEKQIEWESKCLIKADIIIFWIPRDLNDLPGFTTNVEFGYWINKEPNKIILGYPKNTPKIDYLEYYAKKYNVPISNELKETILFSLKE